LAAVPGATNCEFIDGAHAGEVTYARTLVQIAQSDAALKPALNPPLSEWIKINAGKVSQTSAQYAGNKLERDFLKLGCKR